MATRVTIGMDELVGRARSRLAGSQSTVAWRDGSDHILIHAGSMRARATDGWLACNLTVEGLPPTGGRLVQLVFFLGSRAEGAGPMAAATIVATDPVAAQLADRWGDDLLRVVWDAVLDALDVAVGRARAAHPGADLVLSGFSCTDASVLIDIATSAA